MEGVGDQGDGHIVLGEGLVEGIGISNVEGNGRGVLEAFAELLGALEGSAGCLMVQLALRLLSTESMKLTNSNLDISLAENLNGRLGDLIRNQLVSFLQQKQLFRMRGTGYIASPTT